MVFILTWAALVFATIGFTCCFGRTPVAPARGSDVYLPNANDVAIATLGLFPTFPTILGDAAVD